MYIPNLINGFKIKVINNGDKKLIIEFIYKDMDTNTIKYSFPLIIHNVVARSLALHIVKALKISENKERGLDK